MQKMMEEKIDNMSKWCLVFQEEWKSFADMMKIKKTVENMELEQEIGTTEEEGGYTNGEESRMEDNISVVEETYEEKVEEEKEEGEKKEGLVHESGLHLDEDGWKNDHREVLEGHNERLGMKTILTKRRFLRPNNRYKNTYSLKMFNLGVRARSNKKSNKIFLPGPCSGIPFMEHLSPLREERTESEKENNTSVTISMSIERGREGQRVDTNKEERVTEEAGKTIEVGRMVGVVFNNDTTSAIEKLMEMEK